MTGLEGCRSYDLNFTLLTGLYIDTRRFQHIYWSNRGPDTVHLSAIEQLGICGTVKVMVAILRILQRQCQGSSKNSSPASNQNSLHRLHNFVALTHEDQKKSFLDLPLHQTRNHVAKLMMPLI